MCFMLLKLRQRSSRRAKDKILRNFWGFLLLSLGLISPCGAETFRNPRHIAIPSNPLQVGTADFNGDGRPDFYYADASGLNVILANSDGSYAAPRRCAFHRYGLQHHRRPFSSAMATERFVPTAHCPSPANSN